jgi:hypothetical protein
MTTEELSAARDFWNNFTILIEMESNKQGLKFTQTSSDEIVVETKDRRVLTVRFKPADRNRQLSYELEDGTLKELQFVLAEGKSFFRYEGVNHSFESLGSKMLAELLASR